MELLPTNSAGWSNSKTSNLEHVSSCYLCGGTSFNPKETFIQTDGEWRYLECAQCKLLSLNPRPSENAIYTTYSTAYYPWVSLTDRTQDVGRIYSSLRKLYRWITSDYPQFDQTALNCLMNLPKGSLLDAGCGPGNLFAALSAQGWQVEGLDWSPALAAEARTQGFIVHEAHAGGFSTTRKYKVILLNHVIEHIYDLITTLTKLRELLEPGGTIVCVTPNPKALYRQIFRQAWVMHSVPFHTYLFTDANIKKIFLKAGFSSVKVNSPFSYFGPGVWIAKKWGIDLAGRKPFVLFLLSKSVVSILALAGRLFHLVRPLSGEALIVRARV